MSDFFSIRRKYIMNNFNLARMNAGFTVKAEGFNKFNFFAEALRILNIGEYRVNYADAGLDRKSVV